MSCSPPLLFWEPRLDGLAPPTNTPPSLHNTTFQQLSAPDFGPFDKKFKNIPEKIMQDGSLHLTFPIFAK